MSLQTKKARQLPGEVTFAALPGPTRKRVPSPYCYRLVFTNEPEAVGCSLLWEVLGGREVYQVVLERLATGEMRYHCTCPDAVYRGESRPHTCKHIRGLQSIGRGKHEIELN